MGQLSRAAGHYMNRESVRRGSQGGDLWVWELLDRFPGGENVLRPPRLLWGWACLWGAPLMSAPRLYPTRPQVSWATAAVQMLPVRVALGSDQVTPAPVPSAGNATSPVFTLPPPSAPCPAHPPLEQPRPRQPPPRGPGLPPLPSGARSMAALGLTLLVEINVPRSFGGRQPASLRLASTASPAHPPSLPASSTCPLQAPGLPCPSRPHTSALAASSCHSPGPCMLLGGLFTGCNRHNQDGPPDLRSGTSCQPQARE